MKKRTISFLCGLLVAACSPELYDENSVLENNRQQAEMSVEVQVSGTMVSTRTVASDDERAVTSYDIYIFDVTANALQYYKQGIVPIEPEKIAGTHNYRIGNEQIVLPTSGQKHVFVLGNAGSSVTLPPLVTLDEATESTPATALDDFRNSVVVTPQGAKTPAAPFVMAGTTFIASAGNAHVPVCLARTVTKISLRNMYPGQIVLSDVSVSGASASVYPFVKTISVDLPTVDYPAAADLIPGEEAGAFYLLPATANQTAVTVKGTLSGTDFTCKTTLASTLYADYDYKLTLRNRDGEVTAVLSPDFSGAAEVDAIQITGEWLSDKNTVTLPFTPEPNYGFTIGYILNVDGSAEVEKGSEDWYDAVIVKEGTIRIRTLKENLGEDRTASFAVNAGGATCNVKVIQQGLAGVKTIKFGNLEWMDRSIGATLRASQAFANDVRSFGYLYQWGRTVPFPATGDVETVSEQMTPSEALASPAFIAYTGETQDWNSQGVEGSFDQYWESVTKNPCPEGWRLPTYEEMADVMLYRNNALVFANGQQKAAEVLPNGVTHSYVGFGSGAIATDTETMFHSGIKHKGTADAWYVRYLWINKGGTQTTTPPSYSKTHEKDTQNHMTGGENILRIDRLKADASADFPKAADARNFWPEHETDPAVETLVFPCGGRRDATGTVVESNNAAFYWSRSMFTGGDNQYSKTATTYASGLLYFRPAGRYMFLYAPAIGTAQVHADTEDLGYRNQAMQIRCVKDK